TDPHYLTHLLQYHKALNQRNRLLKQFYDDRRWDQPAIALWDQQLALHGTPLYQSRHDFLKAYLPLFQQYHTSITDGAEEVEIRWESHADIPLQQQLEQAYRADRSAQYTTVGPHKDDLILLVGGLPAKKIASQGQQKTLVVALKLAQSDYLRQRCGTPPILLLDDIFDKLDLTRVTQLMQIVGSTPFGQTFVTDTQPGRVQHILTQIPPMQHNTYIATPGTLTLTDNTSHV
ncbi:MAG: DNA replication and repair protein RecF, partial [Bacteroidales bacterium]|nr:DNA replication and repair protein RecF [Bacteroidales bacterium]